MAIEGIIPLVARVILLTEENPVDGHRGYHSAGRADDPSPSTARMRGASSEVTGDAAWEGLQETL